MDPYQPRRRSTFEVRVGDVGIGGDNPLRIQSMTTANTLDTRATVDQIAALAQAGCEIVRLTVPSQRDAENLVVIRREMKRRGVHVPLVADIHFTPKAALLAAEHVEKVRVNPGNFADKKRFEVREYSDAQYRIELERVAERFRPLVRRMKELGVALRIGTNHGSLSDRILNRYGDTPEGMVESALEFLAVCEQENFRDVVFSMKASNPKVAIHVYRLLAARLAQRTPDVPSYPFHLGVTEAGDGEDGRIKSAIGIGSLLADGIGDTLRVSLTEDPLREIPVAQALARQFAEIFGAPAALSSISTVSPTPLDMGADYTPNPYAYARRETRALRCGSVAVGGSEPVRVELEIGAVGPDPKQQAAELATALARVPALACEGFRVDARGSIGLARLPLFAEALAVARLSQPLIAYVEPDGMEQAARVAARIAVRVEAPATEADWIAAVHAADKMRVSVEWVLGAELPGILLGVDCALVASKRAALTDVVFSLVPDASVHAVRVLAARLCARGENRVPIVLRTRRDPARSAEENLLAAAFSFGALLCDGIGDAVSLAGFGSPDFVLPLAYRVLQGARQRTTWTEYISCPSCGRTLFDLEETTARIKEKTAHLAGVKIAVMGCIVNGPGEMADADFGYVGSGPDLVNLYVGKEVVARHVPAATAPDRLVALIQQHGRWSEPA